MNPDVVQDLKDFEVHCLENNHVHLAELAYLAYTRIEELEKELNNYRRIVKDEKR